MFLLALAVLVCEGWQIASLFLPRENAALRLCLALPLAAVSNVLLFFLFTVTSIPLSTFTVWTGHTVISLGLTAFTILSGIPHPRTDAPGKKIARNSHSWLRPLRIICLLLLTNLAAFSIAHALLLPSFSIDSFTNWTMRAKISWTDQRMAFDTDETRGMAKPQYPFLTHALQIAGNAGRHDWSDRAANASTWLLSLSAFSALFLLLRKMRGVDTALLTLTLILGIPLMSIHLAQGYGDIHLTEYLLLALVALALFTESNRREWALLSAIFMLGALWTKSEGIVFGFVPWTVLVLLFATQKKTTLRFSAATIAGTFALFAPFLAFLRFKGLPLTPHGTDATFAFHPEGLAALWPSLFGLGSFGILWYALPIATLGLLAAALLAPTLLRREHLPLLLPGWMIVAANLMIYLCTPNVRFLLDGQSFFRQMLPAGALIILACALIIRPRHGSNHHT